jgi:hypothetical protein
MCYALVILTERTNMTELTLRQIGEIWEEQTLQSWPKPGRCTAGEYQENLVAFTKGVLAAAPRADLRERIAVSQLAALTSVYWEEETVNSYTTADTLMKCHCETAVEYADALIKALNKQREQV